MGITTLEYLEEPVTVHPTVAADARDFVCRHCPDADQILEMLGLS